MIVAIIIVLLFSIPLALFSSNNIQIQLLVKDTTAADASTLSSSSGSTGNQSVDIPAISASKIKFSHYDNPGIGIKFLYPLGWEPVNKKGSDNSTIIEILFPNITSNNNRNTSSISSSGHWHGPATSFIVLSIVDGSSNLTDDSNNITETLNSLTRQNLPLANQTLPNFQLISSNETTFAGNPAYRIVYTFTEPSLVTPSDFPFQSMNVWTVKGDKQYTLSYSQPIEEFPTYLGVVQQIVESFEIAR